MPRVHHSIVERIRTFRAAWRGIAPDATFAGMTIDEFEEASKAPLALRDEIRDLETMLARKRMERKKVDANASQLLDLVVNSVRGTPGFGEDCALYNGFGYTRKKDRKSGLIRKKSKSAGQFNPDAGGEDAGGD